MNLSDWGLNIGVVGAIVGVCEYLKQYKVKEQMKEFYFIIPLVLAVIASLALTKPLEWQGFLKGCLLYFGAVHLGYKGILKRVKK